MTREVLDQSSRVCHVQIVQESPKGSSQSQSSVPGWTLSLLSRGVFAL